MTNRTRGSVIYLAGPLTTGTFKPGINLDEAMKRYKSIIEEGYTAIVPHLTMYAEWSHGCMWDHDRWMEISLDIMSRCDAVWRFGGMSKGADLEAAHAKELGIPVYHTLDDIIANVPKVIGREESLPEVIAKSLLETAELASQKTKEILDRSVLEKAQHLTTGDRNKDYGDYDAETKRIKSVWDAITGLDIKRWHIPLMMIGLKIMRQCHKPKQDNLVDIAGYASIADQIKEDG